MFTFEIERKPVFFLCKLVFGGRKRYFSLRQAMWIRFTSIVRVPYKRCSRSAQALFVLRTSVLRVKKVLFLHVSCMFMSF